MARRPRALVCLARLPRSPECRAATAAAAAVAVAALFPAQSSERGPGCARVASQAAPRAPRPLPRWWGPD